MLGLRLRATEAFSLTWKLLYLGGINRTKLSKTFTQDLFFFYNSAQHATACVQLKSSDGAQEP